MEFTWNFIRYLLNKTKIYTFNQFHRIKGNNICVGHIDTAMIIIPYNLCKNETWIVDLYDADGYYIKKCCDDNKNKLVYIDNNLCYYNKLMGQTS